MPTVMNRHHHSTVDVYKTAPQKICLALGYILLLVGIAGSVMPALMKMHLSMTHNFIHLSSGALALWFGYADRGNRAFNFCVALGTVYGLLGILGFVLGSPGYPAVGHMEADQNLWRTIPNALEFGTMDHFIHLLVSSIFLFTAWSARKDRRPRGVVKSKSYKKFNDLEEVNRRTTLRTSTPKFNNERRV